MTRSTLAAALFIATALSACGGGGGSNSTSVAVAATTYTYVLPQAGAQLVYADTLVDNLNNTINRSLAVGITAVSPGAGYTATEADPTNNRVATGAIDHSFYPTTYTYDAAGRATGWTLINASGLPVQCQVTGAQLAGAPSPLAEGQAWNATYTETCGGGAGLAYTQTGTFIGIESVTVPAGTFSAYKFVSTTSWTVNGRMTTETVTRWRDTAPTGSRVLKSVAAFAYSGTAAPQGALVSETQSLQSFH